MDILKSCSKCGKQKPLTGFNRNAASPDGRRPNCKDCQVQLTFTSRRNRKLLLRYGVTPERYNELFREQGGVCTICGLPETALSNNGAPRQLAVDHCHKTGRVRGLLCGVCNRLIATFSDDPAMFRTIVSYLERDSGGPET